MPFRIDLVAITALTLSGCGTTPPTPSNVFAPVAEALRCPNPPAHLTSDAIAPMPRPPAQSRGSFVALGRDWAPAVQAWAMTEIKRFQDRDDWDRQYCRSAPINLPGPAN